MRHGLLFGALASDRYRALGQRFAACCCQSLAGLDEVFGIGSGCETVIGHVHDRSLGPRVRLLMPFLSAILVMPPTGRVCTLKATYLNLGCAFALRRLRSYLEHQSQGFNEPSIFIPSSHKLQRRWRILVLGGIVCDHRRMCCGSSACH